LQWEQIFESQKNLTLESPSLAPAPDFGQDQHQKYSNREAKYKKKKKTKKERKKESKCQLVLYKGFVLLFSIFESNLKFHMLFSHFSSRPPNQHTNEGENDRNRVI
jgi:hypothetical protein